MLSIYNYSIKASVYRRYLSIKRNYSPINQLRSNPHCGATWSLTPFDATCTYLVRPGVDGAARTLCGIPLLYGGREQSDGATCSVFKISLSSTTTMSQQVFTVIMDLYIYTMRINFAPYQPLGIRLPQPYFSVTPLTYPHKVGTN